MCIHLSIPVRAHLFCDFRQSNTSTTILLFLCTIAFSLRFATIRHPKSSTRYFSTSRPGFYIHITVAYFHLSPLLFYLNKFPSVGYLRFLQIYLKFWSLIPTGASFVFLMLQRSYIPFSPAGAHQFVSKNQPIVTAITVGDKK